MQIRIQIVGAKIYQIISPKVLQILDFAHVFSKWCGLLQKCWKFHGNRMTRSKVIGSRRLQKLQKTLFFVWQTFKIALFYLNCFYPLLFIAYFSMSTSSITICLARNDKSFETFKKVTFWQYILKNGKKGPRIQIQPHVFKSMNCIKQERIWWYWST